PGHLSEHRARARGKHRGGEPARRGLDVPGCAPRARAGAAVPAPSVEVERPRTTGARILVVDDEPLLGQTLSFAFRGKHEVIVAVSGREALARLAVDSRYDLVLCDLMMPDVSGQNV